MTSISTFDAIVIGAGQAGPPLVGRLAAAGMSVAVVERHLFGGTCVNTGCTPTKTLVASAEVAHQARRAAEYGVRIEGRISIDMRAVKARKDKIVATSRDGIEIWLGSMKGCTVFKGHARFESAQQVRVGDTLLRAKRIFVNVGGRAIPILPAQPVVQPEATVQPDHGDQYRLMVRFYGPQQRQHRGISGGET